MSEDLAAFIEQVTGDSHLRVEEDLGDGFVRLRTAEAERRQARHDIRSSEDVVIELLRNSRDAHARNIFVATSKEADTRRITVIDDGDGIPEKMHERIFDARVTSKLDTMHMDLWGVHGRGMALYAVKVNAERAEVVASKVDGGSSVFVEIDTRHLGEKRDQSSMPTFLVSEEGIVTVRGPKNINRTICEFAYIERSRCKVFHGSPAEIAATLWHLGRNTLTQSVIAFCSDPQDLAVWKRLAIATAPEEFAEIASSIGLTLSSRTARRIIDGDIAELHPVTALITPASEDANVDKSIQRKRDEAVASLSDDAADESDFLSNVLFKDTRGLRLAEDDRIEFQRGIAKAYRKLAKAYYLDATIQPDVKIRKDRIDVYIPVIKQK